MTDNEIIKGLECCANNGDCKECPINPHHGNYGYCTSLAIKHALDLINRQRAEIERLKKNNAERVGYFGKLLEAEKRKGRSLARIAESEAIKEFARRIKATFPEREDPRCTYDDIFTLNSIDQIKKDMLSEATKGRRLM